MLEAAAEQLAQIAGQQPSVRRARKSIAAFKLREGMPVGVAVTLRGERAYEFLDRLISIAIPRIRDFRGLPAKLDGRGNYAIGVREQIIFPEIDYDAIDEIRGLDVTITTSAKTDEEAYALLEAFGYAVRPKAARGRRSEDRPWPRLHCGSSQSRPHKYSSREYSRCNHCGRPRSVYRKFGICRICLRELATTATSPA